MNARKIIKHQPKGNAYNTGMQKPVVFSILLHVGIVVLGTFGLPYIARKSDPIEMAITVEMVDLAAISQTDNLAPPREAKKPDEVPRPPEPPKPVYNKAQPQETAPPPELLTPKPPEVEEIPEPPKPEEKKPEEKPKPPEPPKPAPPKPQNKPKPPAPKPAPEEKKPEEKKEPEPDITSLLNSVLSENTPAPSPKQDEDEKPKSDASQISQIAPVTGQLSRSELDDLNRGVQPCWNVNAGGKYAEELKVSLRVSLNTDMSVRDVQILDQNRYNSDTAFRAAADAARRALLNPTCNKLRLPQEKYEQWKVFTYHFDPSQML